MTARSESLSVFVRVRPPIFKEVKEDTAVTVGGTQSLTVVSESKEISCSYDHVFNEVSEQQTVFEKVQPLLVDVLSGVNSCIFAYGQTSAGKSFTMIGPNGGQDILRCDKAEWGILPRASEFLLGYLNEKSQEGLLSYEVKASFLQIYNENLYDLLRDTGPMIEDKLLLSENGGKDSELKIRETPVSKRKNKDMMSGSEVFVSGLSEFRVQTAEDILRILAVGTANRMTRSTDFNVTSSRSHAILQLTFEIESHMESGQTIVSRSKLNLVDLAGSEKIPFVNSDMNNAKHMKELTSINKSLSSLGNVIAALSSNNRTHIPYRDSKLTRILQDSLSGNTRTILIACVAPTVLHTSESISTLQFADRAKNVMLTVKANTLVDDKVMLAKAQSEITRLKALLTHALKQLEQKSVGGDNYGGEIEKLAAENEQLRKENAGMKHLLNTGTGSHLGSLHGLGSTPGRKKANGYSNNGAHSSRSSLNGDDSSVSSRRGPKQVLDTKALLEGLSRPKKNPQYSGRAHEAFSDFSGPEKDAKPAFGRKKTGAKSKNGNNSDSEAEQSSHEYRKVRKAAHQQPPAPVDVLDAFTPKQKKDKEKESRVRSTLYKAINDRQVDELNQRLANANQKVQEDERDDLETTDSISSLLGIPRRLGAPAQRVAESSVPMILEETTVTEGESQVETNPPGLLFSPTARPGGAKVDFNLDPMSPLAMQDPREQDPYTKLTTPSVQKPDSHQFTPTNRIFLKNKNGNGRVNSSGSTNSYYQQQQPSSHHGDGFLQPDMSGGGYTPNKPGGITPAVAGTAILAMGIMSRPQPAAEAHRAVSLSHSKDDVGTPVQMFSFRANTWDRVDILDYDDNKRLHKVRFLDGSIQWLDLTKKPVREFPLEKF